MTSVDFTQGHWPENVNFGHYSEFSKGLQEAYNTGSFFMRPSDNGPVCEQTFGHFWNWRRPLILKFRGESDPMPARGPGILCEIDDESEGVIEPPDEVYDAHATTGWFIRIQSPFLENSTEKYAAQVVTTAESNPGIIPGTISNLFGLERLLWEPLPVDNQT